MTAALLLIFRTTQTITFWFTVLLLLSFPTTLAVERGNGDVLMFSIIVLSFYAQPMLRRSAGWSLAAFAVAVTTLLKIYPVAAAVANVKERKNLVGTAVMGLLAVGMLLVTSGPELKYVYQSTPFGTWGMFGNGVLLLQLNYFFSYFPSDNVRLLADVVTVPFILASIYFGARADSRSVGIFPALKPNDPLDNVALACLCTFAFAFCLGSNWDYRLLFLLGATPPLIAQYERDGNRYAKIALTVLLAFFWSSRRLKHAYPVNAYTR